MGVFSHGLALDGSMHGVLSGDPYELRQRPLVGAGAKTSCHLVSPDSPISRSATLGVVVLRA